MRQASLSQGDGRQAGRRLWATGWGARRGIPTRLQGLGVPWRGKAPALRRYDFLAGALWQLSTVCTEWQMEKNSFLNERTGNVYENKGPLWEIRERSGNVHEKTGG
jgi:hypothetical protein